MMVFLSLPENHPILNGLVQRGPIRAKVQDARSKPVYDGARQMYLKLQGELAERNESELFKVVQGYKAEMETLSGYPVRLQSEALAANVGATIQMAWKYQRDHHLLKIRASYPPH
jgi:hypothetical protein